MAALDYFEVSVFGLDLKKNLCSHFSEFQNPWKRFKLHLEKFSTPLDRTICEGKYHFILDLLVLGGLAHFRVKVVCHCIPLAELGSHHVAPWEPHFT